MGFSSVCIQGIGVVGTVLYFLSFQCRSSRRLFAVQFLSYLCYTCHLLLLGAATGGVSYIVNLIRSFCLAGKWKFGRSRRLCVLLCLAQIAVAMLTWAGWISLLPVVANIASTIGGYTHNARKIRVVSLAVNSPLWIIYDVLVGSWAGVLDEAVSDFSIVLSIIRFGWKNMDSE